MTQSPNIADATERRGNKVAIPPNLSAILTRDQSVALRKVENFGWTLAFVRQPLSRQRLRSWSALTGSVMRCWRPTVN